MNSGRETDRSGEGVSEKEDLVGAKGDYMEVTDNNVRQLIVGLKRDGLLKGGSTLAVKNKALYINGTKQAESVNRRYADLITGKDFDISVK